MTVKQKSKQWQYFNPFDPYLLSNVQNTFLSCLYTPEFAALSWISKLCWCGPQYLLTVLPFLISTLLSGVTFTPPPHCNTAPAFHTHTRAHLYSHTYTHAHVNPQASSCPHPHPPLPNCTSKACSITSKKNPKIPPVTSYTWRHTSVWFEYESGWFQWQWNVIGTVLALIKTLPLILESI